jgi:hypothetical protein
MLHLSPFLDIYDSLRLSFGIDKPDT